MKCERVKYEKMDSYNNISDHGANNGFMYKK